MRIVTVILFATLFFNSFAQEELSKNEFSLIQAAETGKTEVVLKLLEQDTDLNCSGWDGMTPLHYAVQNGHLIVVKTLLLNGAEVNAQDIDERTPLALAVHFNQLEIAEYLVQNKADPNIADYNGLTPMFYAAAYGDYYMTDMFLFYKGKQDIRDQGGKTPFLAAIWGGFPHVAYLLKEYGANTEAKDKLGNTGIMLAVANKDTVSLDSLIQWGVNVNATNKKNLSALDLAIRHQNIRMIKQLLDYGADPNHEIQTGYNSLDYAKSLGAEKRIEQMLLEAGAEHSKGLRLSHISLGMDSRLNQTDAYLGLTAEILDIRSQLGIQVRVSQRPGRIKVYFPVNDSTDYLFRETRTSFSLGAFKLWPLVILPNGYQWGLRGALNGTVSVGQFKASNLTPAVGYAANPEVGFYFSDANIRYQAGYVHRIGNQTPVSPSMLTFSLVFSITPKPF